jgi:hypothetical protein
MSALMTIFHTGEKFMGLTLKAKGVFWLSFVFNVLLTPIAGIIYFFLKLIGDKK